MSLAILKIDPRTATEAGRHVTMGAMETLALPTTYEDPTSVVGRRFLDGADNVRQLSSRLAQVAGRVAGVRAMLAIDGSGQVLVSASDVPEVEVDGVGALAATLVLLAKASASNCALGTFSHVVVELEGGSLVAQPMADGRGTIVALADLECDMATLVAELALMSGHVGLPSIRVVDVDSGTGRAGRARSFVRPFVLTGGRTESPVAMDALVWCLLEPLGRITPEQVAVLRACDKPRSLGEIAEVSGLPIGVVRVVVGDLMAAGWVAASMFELSSSPADLYPRIIEALEALV